jgi:hypothetical protein
MKIGLIITLVVLLTVGAVGIGSYVSSYNFGNRSERAIEAGWENLQNILGQYSLKVKEAAQIPSMQTEDLAKLFTGSLEARYGADGSQAAMQWIREQNPLLDQSTYVKIQQIIEAGRNKFENEQTKFIDVKRVYETALGSFWQGMWLSVAGYPKIDLAKYKTITSQHAKVTFETGVDEGLKLR